MADNETPAVEQGTGTPIDQIPTDFREYNRWRSTGELPSHQGEKQAVPAAAGESASSEAPEPPAKTAPESEPDDYQETESIGADGQPLRTGSRQRKIDRLIRENSELQRRLQALEQTGPAAAAVTTPVPTTPPPAPAGPKPVLTDFKTLEDYTEALTEWKIDQREARRKADEEKRTAEAAAKSLQDGWAAKEGAALKAHPDYSDVIASTRTPEGPGVMAAREALLEDEHGAEILYWLAKNSAELKRIASLSPARAILEIGKLSAAFASPVTPENPKPKVTSAPRPPSPISHGTVKTAPDVNDEDFARRDFRGWNRVREAQLKGK
jgi:hypothetical protein